jgi:hypothetical protein
MILRPQQHITNDSHSKILLHYDENGATSFETKNDAKSALVGSSYGGASLTYTVDSKFGSRSLDNSSMTYNYNNYGIDIDGSEITYINTFFKITSTPPSTSSMFCIYASLSDRMYLFINSSRQMKVTFYSGGSIVSSPLYSSALSLNTWYELKLYISTTMVCMIVNNEKVEYALSSPPNISSGLFYYNSVGGNSTFAFTGIHDEFHMKQGVIIPEAHCYITKNRAS